MQVNNSWRRWQASPRAPVGIAGTVASSEADFQLNYLLGLFDRQKQLELASLASEAPPQIDLG